MTPSGSISVTADGQRCCGSGRCAVRVPEVFAQRLDNGLVQVIEPTPPTHLIDKVLQAEAACPTRAIRTSAVKAATLETVPRTPMGDERHHTIQDVDFASATLDDLWTKLAALRATGKSVIQVRYHQGNAYMLMSYDSIEKALQNGKQTADTYDRLVTDLMGRVWPTLHGKEHRAHRALVVAPFIPARVRERIQKLLIPTANEIIDAWGERREVDILRDFGTAFPYRVTMRMLGLPIEDEARMFHEIELLHNGGPWQYERTRVAAARVREYLAPFVSERRRNPGSDLISEFASVKVEGKTLNEEDLLKFVRFLFPAGFGNTQMAIAALFYHVLRDPAIEARVRANPVDRAAAIEEALRMEPPLALANRFTEEPITIDGVDIPAGSWLFAPIAWLNRDPRRFPDPDRFSLDRPPVEHFTFGRGAHFCPGNHLARAEMRVGLDTVLSRLKDVRLVNADDVQFLGGILRGPVRVMVAFDAILPPQFSPDDSTTARSSA
jgi:cytochrome P450/ferredoxin